MPPSTVKEVPVEELANAIVKATREARAEERTIEVRNPPRKSVFNPTGGPRPKLKCPTVFCGSHQDETALTNEEIELFNQVEPGRYHSGKWQCIVRDDGMGETQEYKEIRIPIATIDDRMTLPPSLVAILREMLAERAPKAA